MGMFKKLGEKTGFSDPDITCDIASLRSRYYDTTNLSFEKIVNNKIKDIDSKIKDVSNLKPERFIAVTVQEGQESLYEIIKKHFEEKGFNCFFTDQDRLPELGPITYLFISWNKITQKELDILNPKEEEEEKEEEE